MAKMKQCDAQSSQLTTPMPAKSKEGEAANRMTYTSPGKKPPMPFKKGK